VPRAPIWPSTFESRRASSRAPIAGDGAGAHVGDVARVDDGDRHAGARVEQVEQRQLGRQADLVVAVEVADDLDARHGERPDVAAQDVEVARAVLLGLQVHARLDRRLAAPLRDEALLDRRDDLGVAQRQRLDVGMVEVVEMDLAGAAGRGGGPCQPSSIGSFRPCSRAHALAIS
jgi:hypothetical protein